MAQRGPGGEKGNTVVVFIETFLIAPFTLSVTLVETLIVTPLRNNLPYKLMVPPKNPLAPPPPTPPTVHKLWSTLFRDPYHFSKAPL